MVEKLLQIPNIHEISVKGQRILDSLPEEVVEEHFMDMGDYIEFFRLSWYNYDVIKFKDEDDIRAAQAPEDDPFD